MQVHFGSSPNWIVLHDLRIEHNGLIAQIDHLIINRLLEVWVCESKHFSEGVAINEHAEFCAFFGSKPYGVPSPIEQNNRHILILNQLFNSDAFLLPKRLGFTLKPALKGLVLVSKKARISRPSATIDGLDVVIKNDQLFKTISKTSDESSVLIIAKVISSESLLALGQALVNLHKPIAFNWPAKFGLLEPDAALTEPDLHQAEPKVARPRRPKTLAAPEPLVLTLEPAVPRPKVKRIFVCNSCSAEVPYNVAAFCRFNKQRFGEHVYCRDCQAKV
jgi:hypothetical protein